MHHDVYIINCCNLCANNQTLSSNFLFPASYFPLTLGFVYKSNYSEYWHKDHHTVRLCFACCLGCHVSIDWRALTYCSFKVKYFYQICDTLRWDGVKSDPTPEASTEAESGRTVKCGAWNLHTSYATVTLYIVRTYTNMTHLWIHSVST